MTRLNHESVDETRVDNNEPKSSDPDRLWPRTIKFTGLNLAPYEAPLPPCNSRYLGFRTAISGSILAVLKGHDQSIFLSRIRADVQLRTEVA